MLSDLIAYVKAKAKRGEARRATVFAAIPHVLLLVDKEQTVKKG
jgi:hypothetical protein